MQELLQTRKQLAGIRGEKPLARPAVATPRPGVLGQLLAEPEPVGPTVSEARSIDTKGRVSLGETAEAAGITEGEKVAVTVDPVGVITVRRFEGEDLDRSAATAVIDQRRRLTLPAWVRTLIGLQPGDAVLSVATADGLRLFTPAAVMRLYSSPTMERSTP